MGHLILFADTLYRGEHKHVFENTELGDFNDKVSSFVVLEGSWKFFADFHFQSQMGVGGGRMIGPGRYPTMEAAFGTGSNDKLSSIMYVGYG